MKEEPKLHQFGAGVRGGIGEYDMFYKFQTARSETPVSCGTSDVGEEGGD